MLILTKLQIKVYSRSVCINFLWTLFYHNDFQFLKNVILMVPQIVDFQVVLQEIGNLRRKTRQRLFRQI